MQEIPFELTNHNGCTLYGILHVPDRDPRSGQRRIGVNILVPGIKYRVAPHRLNVKIARRLCSEGFYVLRFDPEGVGESDGDLGQNRLLKDIFFDIQNGLFVNDTILSNQFLKVEYKLDDIAMIGDCGGAATALLASEKSNVNNLILIDLPVIYSKGVRYRDQILQGGINFVNRAFQKYLKKTISLHAWIRFVTFKSDYLAICNLLRARFKNYSIKGIAKAKSKSEFIQTHILTDGVQKLNIKLFEACQRFQENKGKALFICSELDANTQLFEYYFAKKLIQMKFDEKSFKKQIIKNANHIYTDINAQKDLIEFIAKWLREIFL